MPFKSGKTKSFNWSGNSWSFTPSILTFDLFTSAAALIELRSQALDSLPNITQTTTHKRRLSLSFVTYIFFAANFTYLFTCFFSSAEPWKNTRFFLFKTSFWTLRTILILYTTLQVTATGKKKKRER